MRRIIYPQQVVITNRLYDSLPGIIDNFRKERCSEYSFILDNEDEKYYFYTTCRGDYSFKKTKDDTDAVLLSVGFKYFKVKTEYKDIILSKLEEMKLKAGLVDAELYPFTDGNIDISYDLSFSEVKDIYFPALTKKMLNLGKQIVSFLESEWKESLEYTIVDKEELTKRQNKMRNEAYQFLNELFSGYIHYQKDDAFYVGIPELDSYVKIRAKNTHSYLIWCYIECNEGIYWADELKALCDDYAALHRMWITDFKVGPGFMEWTSCNLNKCLQADFLEELWGIRVEEEVLNFAYRAKVLQNKVNDYVKKRMGEEE